METDSRHQCLIYEGSPSKKLRMLADIICRKLDEGYRCMYFNSTPMVAGMRSTLASLGVDVTAEMEQRRLVLSSEPTTSNGEFHSEEMLNKLEDFLDEALSDGYKGLWASGDMTWEFGAKKNFSKLMEYESGLEELFQRRKELCGICQYHMDTLPWESLRTGILTHPHLVINETLTLVNPYFIRSSSIDDTETNDKLDEMIVKLCRQQSAD